MRVYFKCVQHADRAVCSPLNPINHHEHGQDHDEYQNFYFHRDNHAS